MGELGTGEFCFGPLMYDGDHGYPLVYIIKEEGFEICTCFRRGIGFHD